jgi:two-component system response regulator FixJ
MREHGPVVFLVDGDDDLREAMRGLIQAEGIAVAAYRSAEEFLAGVKPDRPACLILELCLPGMGGLKLQERMAEHGLAMPVIVLTKARDVPAAVRAIQSGAVDFLQKPVDDRLLLGRVRRALALDVDARKRRATRDAFTDRLESLTPRERTVVDLVVDGSTSAEIAAALGISEKTVEVYRKHVMKKLETRSVVDLVREVLVHRHGHPHL